MVGVRVNVGVRVIVGVKLAAGVNVISGVKVNVGVLVAVGRAGVAVAGLNGEAQARMASSETRNASLLLFI